MFRTGSNANRYNTTPSGGPPGNFRREGSMPWSTSSIVERDISPCSAKTERRLTRVSLEFALFQNDPTADKPWAPRVMDQFSSRINSTIAYGCKVRRRPPLDPFPTTQQHTVKIPSPARKSCSEKINILHSPAASRVHRLLAA